MACFFPYVEVLRFIAHQLPQYFLPKLSLYRSSTLPLPPSPGILSLHPHPRFAMEGCIYSFCNLPTILWSVAKRSAKEIWLFFHPALKSRVRQKPPLPLPLCKDSAMTLQNDAIFVMRSAPTDLSVDNTRGKAIHRISSARELDFFLALALNPGGCVSEFFLSLRR